MNIIFQFRHFIYRIEEKMSEPTSVYSVDKSREIVGRIRDIRKSLTSGHQEKLSLMHDLARLKDEFLINKLQGGSSSPDVSMLSIPSLQERLEAASQTDLSGDVRSWSSHTKRKRTRCFFAFRFICFVC